MSVDSALSCCHGQDRTKVTYSSCRAARSGSRSTREPIRSPARNACLRQTCPDEASAYVALGRLLAEADGGRFPDRHATVGQALDKYLEVADLEVSTREAHEGYIRRTIGPVLGEVKIRQLGADSLDALYTALKKCSRLCGRLPRTEHYADGEHACDQRCGPLRDHRTTRPHICDSPVPPARVQADEASDDPADPLDHLLGPGPGRPLRVGGPQRRQERQAAASPQARAGPAYPGAGRPAAQPRLGRGRGVRPVPVDRVHDRSPPRRGERPAREPVRLHPPAGPPGPQLPRQAGPAHREGAQGRRGPRPVPGPADLRAVPRAVPAPPRRGAGPRRPGAGRRVRVLPRPGRPRRRGTRTR